MRTEKQVDELISALKPEKGFWNGYIAALKWAKGIPTYKIPEYDDPETPEAT